MRNNLQYALTALRDAAARIDALLAAGELTDNELPDNKLMIDLTEDLWWSAQSVAHKAGGAAVRIEHFRRGGWNQRKSADAEPLQG
jgi:hypothetical protein